MTLPGQSRPSSETNILGQILEMPSVVDKVLTVVLPTHSLRLS